MGRISITYDKITPESAAMGEAEESGWIDELGNTFPSWRDAYDYLADNLDEGERAVESSASHFHKGVWYTAHAVEEDSATQTTTNYSYHLKDFTLEEEAAIWDALIDGGYLPSYSTRTGVDQDEADRSQDGFVISGLGEVRYTRRWRFLVIDESGRGGRGEREGFGDELEDAVLDAYQDQPDIIEEWQEDLRRWSADALAEGDELDLDDPDFSFKGWLEGLASLRIEEIDSEPVEVEVVPAQGRGGGGFVIKGR